VNLLNEVPKHLFANVEIGNDTVTQRPDGLDMRRRAANHALGFGAHGNGPTVFDVDSNYRRLVENDAFAADVHERVGRTQIDSHISANDVGQGVT
jgi:hypothetical protein